MKPLLFLLLLIFVSCAKEEAEVIEIKDLEVTYAPTNIFGVVRIGERKYSGFKIKNNTGSPMKINYSEPDEPFIITERGCDSELAANSECIVKILFLPSRGLDHETTIEVMGEKLTFSGKSLRDSAIELEHIYWDAGEIEAGEIAIHEVKIHNVSDSVLSPPKTNTPNYFILSHTCREEILPDTSCTVRVGVQKTEVGEYDEEFALFTNETPERYGVFKSTVIPSFPAGNIPITCEKQSLIANNDDKTSCSAGPITDDFNNIVKDGTPVNASTRMLYLDNKVIDYTKDGMVNFNIRSTSNNDIAKFIVSTGRASGTSDVKLISGPPIGEIRFKSHQEQISADGNSYIVLETFPMYNESGVPLTDGTEIEVIVDGSGEDISPHHFSLDGVLKVYIRASTVADLNTITVRANPKLVNGETVYLASGQTTLKFAPLSKIGSAEIGCDNQEIVKSTNLNSLNPNQTTCNITNIKDIHGNLVGDDVEVSITLSHGVNSNDLSSFNLLSDENSSVSFVVKGVDQRGDIDIKAIISEIEKNHTIYAIDQLAISHSYYDKNIDLYYLYTDSSRDATDIELSEWSKYLGDFYEIQSLDNLMFGIDRYMGGESSTLATTKDFGMDCLVGVRNYVVSSPCTEIIVNSGSFDYRFSAPIKVGPENDDFEINGIATDFSQFLGNKLMGAVHFYDKYANQIHVFGGSYLESLGSGNYKMLPNRDGLSYSNITLFNNLFTEFSMFSDNYPMFKGYHKGQERSFTFGGIGFISDEDGNQTLEYSNLLLKFEELDLVPVQTVGDSPSERFLPGVFYDEERNDIYVFGGISSSLSILNDIWKLDLDNQILVWEKLGDSFDLGLSYSKAAYLKSLLETQGQNFINYVSNITFSTYRSIVEDVMPPKISLYNKKVYISEFGGSGLKEFDLETHELKDTESLSFLVGRNTYYNSANNRTYILQNDNPGQFETKLTYFDSFKENTLLYRASIHIEEYSYLHALEITPEISATVENEVFDQTQVGLKAYIYNHTNDQWELLGEHYSDKTSIESSFISKRLDNPREYFSPNRTVDIMLTPNFRSGEYQGEIYESPLRWHINSISLKGEF